MEEKSLARMSCKHLLITGASGIGKTTLLKQVVTFGQSQGLSFRGFLSEVIFIEGRRLGWRLDGLGGDGGILAHLDLISSKRMGRYGIDLPLFEQIAERELQPEAGVNLYVVDGDSWTRAITSFQADRWLR